MPRFLLAAVTLCLICVLSAFALCVDEKPVRPELRPTGTAVVVTNRSTPGLWAQSAKGTACCYVSDHYGPCFGLNAAGRENDGHAWGVSIDPREGPVMQIRGADGKLRLLNLTQLADALGAAKQVDPAPAVPASPQIRTAYLACSACGCGQPVPVGYQPIPVCRCGDACQCGGNRPAAVEESALDNGVLLTMLQPAENNRGGPLRPDDWARQIEARREKQIEGFLSDFAGLMTHAKEMAEAGKHALTIGPYLIGGVIASLGWIAVLFMAKQQAR